jgi:hypothetical protein
MAEKYTPAPPFEKHTDDDLDTVARRAYEYLLQIKNIDNQLMWTRSNIVLLVQGGVLAILASQFGTLADKHPTILLFLPMFGLATAYFWWRMTKGGSFWVDYWQTKLRAIEPKVTGNIEIFRAARRTQKQKLDFVAWATSLLEGLSSWPRS